MPSLAVRRTLVVVVAACAVSCADDQRSAVDAGADRPLETNPMETSTAAGPQDTGGPETDFPDGGSVSDSDVAPPDTDASSGGGADAPLTGDISDADEQPFVPDAGPADVDDGSSPRASDVNAMDEGGDEAGSDGDTWCSSPGCPNRLDPSHLRLWLRGDRGVECGGPEHPDRVTAWNDLSGKGNHARPPAGSRGPVCSDLATLNGRHVVRFPLTPDAEAEEHLEVDLNSLVGGSFSIAVVEKRPSPQFGAMIIGSKLPFGMEVDCDSMANRNEGRGLLLGYPSASSFVASTWGLGCDLRVSLPHDLVPPALSRAAATVVTFAPRTGFTVYINGTRLATAQAATLESIGKGLIGRGYDYNDLAGESRYLGDLAELAIFNTALDDQSRTQLEAYFRETWGTGP